MASGSRSSSTWRCEPGTFMSAPRIRGPMNRTALVFALLLSLPLVPLAPATAVDPGPQVTASEPFAPNVRITYGTTPYAQQVEPMLAVDSLGRLFLGWKEALTDSGGGQRVSFSRSLDGGVTWSAAAFMAKENPSPQMLQSDPWLAVDEYDHLYYTWIEYNPPFGQASTTPVARTLDR